MPKARRRCRRRSSSARRRRRRAVFASAPRRGCAGARTGSGAGGRRGPRPRAPPAPVARRFAAPWPTSSPGATAWPDCPQRRGTRGRALGAGGRGRAARVGRRRRRRRLRGRRGRGRGRCGRGRRPRGRLRAVGQHVGDTPKPSTRRPPAPPTETPTDHASSSRRFPLQRFDLAPTSIDPDGGLSPPAPAVVAGLGVTAAQGREFADSSAHGVGEHPHLVGRVVGGAEGVADLPVAQAREQAPIQRASRTGMSSKSPRFFPVSGN